MDKDAFFEELRNSLLSAIKAEAATLVSIFNESIEQGAIRISPKNPMTGQPLDCDNLIGGSICDSLREAVLGQLYGVHQERLENRLNKATYEVLYGRFTNLVDADYDSALGLLEKFEVHKLDGLKPEQYEAFGNALTELGY